MALKVSRKNILSFISFFAFGHGFLGIIVALSAAYCLFTRGNESVTELFLHYGVKLQSLHPGFLVDMLLKITNVHIIFILLLAGAYALVHMVEGYGLWRKNNWGEWFCAIDSAVYIPFELESMYHRMTWLNVTSLILNLILIVYMIYLLKTRRKTQ